MTTEKKKNRKGSAAADPVIPDKLYFRIGEVSRLCRLPAYVLRFWETEFSQLKPVRAAPASACTVSAMWKTFSASRSCSTIKASRSPEPANT